MQQLQKTELNKEEQKLLAAAKKAGARYLNKKGTRHVGAALLGANGTVYEGTSIRRTNTSNSTCAERMALDRAVFEKCYDYKLLAIVGFHNDGSIKEILAPCGMCRQILSEAETYGTAKGPIPMLLADEDTTTIIKTTSAELFPVAYKAKEYSS